MKISVQIDECNTYNIDARLIVRQTIGADT